MARCDRFGILLIIGHKLGVHDIIGENKCLQKTERKKNEST